MVLNMSRDKLKLQFSNSGNAIKTALSRAGRSLGVLALFAGATSTTVFDVPVLADPAPVQSNFSQTTVGAVATTIPIGTCGVVASVTGGGGASHGIGAGGRGAAGAIIGATFRVLPGQGVTGAVASGGVVSDVIGGTSFGGTGTASGGNGGTIVAPSGNQHRGGGGGGSSSISVAGIKLIESGGGGGGGAAHQASPVGNGGNGGFTGIGAGVVALGVNGSVGFQSAGTVGGGQGGQAAGGGALGVNTNNAARNGFAGLGIGTGTGGNGGPDDGIDSAGGGGGGYTGGGGGASTTGVNQTGGGGGGGASFVRGTSPTVAASVPTAITGTAGPVAAPAVTSGLDGAVSLNWVPCLYTLTVAKSASPSPVNAGAKTTWTVTVTNTGPDAMTSGDTLTLNDTLPPGPIGSITPTFRVTSISTSGGSNADMASGAITCTGVTIGSSMPASTTCTRPYSAPSAPGAPSGGTRGLNAGETLSITYEQVFANTASCTSITNVASALDRTAAGSTTLRSASTPLTINCYDLAVVKNVSPTVAGAGQVLTWDIQVTNSGPASMNGPDETAANPLVVNDVAPTTNVSAPVNFTSTGPAGACTYSSPTITCPTGLASGQTQTFTFQQTVNGSAPSGAVITNTANVTDFRTGDSNDSDPASVTLQSNLTLIKTVVNDNGGTNTIADFTLAAAGPTPLSGISGTAAVTNAPVNVGTYTLSESGAALANYNLISWVCTGAGTFTAPNQIAIAAGQSATCTATNNDKPRLTLQKTVVNDDGGTAVDTGFTLTATGPTAGVTGTEGNAAITNRAVDAGTYVLTETGPAGYAASAWTCTAGTLTGNTLALAQNQSATCTITNNDTAAVLTLAKTVTNDNGGTAADTAFTLTATGPTAGVTGVEGNAAITNRAVTAGVYALSETGPSGYAAGAWACTAGTLAGSNLTLAVGQTAICTIINNDTSPVLTLAKTVVNDNGGSNVDADFTLTATGPTAGVSGIEGNANVTNRAVNAGTYVLTESGAATTSYTLISWACTAGTLTGNSLALGVGQTATCTVINNDKPRLTLLKTVVNDNGGTAVDTGFTLTATGPTAGVTGVEGNANITSRAVDAGVYALTETAVGGYAASAWVCAGGTLAGSNLTLAQNQNATCTITNDDVAPLLTLAKTVTNDNGGTAVDTAFTLTATGPTAGVSGVEGNAAVTNRAVTAGVYALTETGPTGYTASAWTCSAGSLAGANLTLSLGQVASCSITNNDIAPTLTLRKISILGVNTFNFTGTNGFGADSIDTTAAGAGNPQSGVTKTLTNGNAITDITETATAGYFLSGVPTCTGMGSGGSFSLVSGTTYRLNAAALPVGSAVVCTFTNTRGVPSLDVTKSPVPGSVNAAGQIISYTIAVANTGNVPVTGITVSDQLGAVVCPTSGNATIASLAVSATENCTLTYAATQANFDNNGGGDGDIDNTADATGTYNASPVSDTGSAAVTLLRTPLLTISKTAIFAPGDDVNGNGFADLGDKVTYRYDVLNTGNLTVNGVDVLDFLRNSFGVFADPVTSTLTDVAPLGDSTDVTAGDGIWSVLAPGDLVRFTSVYTVVQLDVDNLQ